MPSPGRVQSGCGLRVAAFNGRRIAYFSGDAMGDLCRGALNAALVSQLSLAGSGAGETAEGRHRAQGFHDARSSSLRRNLRAGGSWSAQLAQEIADATAFILLVGEAGIGKWQVPEYDEALDRWVKAPAEFPLDCGVARRPDGAGPAVPAAPALDRQPRPGVGEGCRAGCSKRPPATARIPANCGVTPSPYRGLEAMEEKDSDYFFGRNAKPSRYFPRWPARPTGYRS